MHLAHVEFKTCRFVRSPARQIGEYPNRNRVFGFGRTHGVEKDLSFVDLEVSELVTKSTADVISSADLGPGICLAYGDE